MKLEKNDVIFYDEIAYHIIDTESIDRSLYASPLWDSDANIRVSIFECGITEFIYIGNSIVNPEILTDEYWENRLVEL